MRPDGNMHGCIRRTMDRDRSVEEMVLKNRRVGGVGGFQVRRDITA